MYIDWHSKRQVVKVIKKMLQFMMFITAFGVLFVRREMTEILSDAALSRARYINLVLIFYKKLAVLASKIACCELLILFSRRDKQRGHVQKYFYAFTKSFPQ